MRPAFVAVLCLAAACDEPAPKDVSPVTPIPGLPPPPAKPAALPVQPPVPAAPPAPVIDEDELIYGPRRATANRIDAGTPSPADLSGPFDVRVSRSNGFSGTTESMVLKGDHRGATASFTDDGLEGQRREKGQFAIPASDVAKFLAELDGLEWWTLGDEGVLVMDATGTETTVRRGSRTHTWSVQHQCGCTHPCACPQLRVGQALAALIDTARATAHAKAPAPKVETFVAPVVKGNAVRCSQKTCEDVRCFPQGGALACFKTPFDGTGVLISPEKGFPAAHRPGKDSDPVWAFELENGITCVHKASPRSHWTCNGGQTFHSDADLAFESRGKAKVVRFSAGGEARRVVRVWK